METGFIIAGAVVLTAVFLAIQWAIECFKTEKDERKGYYAQQHIKAVQSIKKYYRKDRKKRYYYVMINGKQIRRQNKDELIKYLENRFLKGGK